MTASSRPSALHSGVGLVVVCCAHDDAASLREALGSLRDDGHEVELVDGLDANPKHLGEVIDRLEGEGLYVLCRSPQLGRERVEELRELLLARHIPFARTLTVAVGGRGALVDRIRSGLRRATARGGGGGVSRSKPARASTPIPKSTPATPQPVIKRSSQPIVPDNVTGDEEPTLVGLREPGSPDFLVPSPSGSVPRPVPRAPSQIPPSAPAPTPVEASPADTPSPAAPSPPLDDDNDGDPDDDRDAGDADGERDEDTVTMEDPSASTSAAAISVSDLDLSDLDASDLTSPPPLDTTSLGTPPPLITGNTVIGPAPVMITGNTVVGVRMSDLKAVPGSAPWPPEGKELQLAPFGDAEPSTEPFPRLRDSSRPAPLPATPAPSDSSPFAPSAPLSVPPSAPLSVPPSAPLGSPAMAPPVATEAPSSRTLPLVLGVVALLLLGLVITLAVWPSDDGKDEIAAKDAEAEKAAKDAADKEAKAKAEQEARDKANEPPPPPPEYPVVNALEARQVRALDVLLIATDPSKPSDFLSATSFCEQLDIQGLVGWRLPHVGELSSLSRANMIGRRGYFWSSTAADTFGDDHLAWNVRRGYAQPYEKNAVAVCVRGGVTGS